MVYSTPDWLIITDYTIYRMLLVLSMHSFTFIANPHVMKPPRVHKYIKREGQTSVRAMKHGA